MRTPWKQIKPIDAERDYVGVVTELVPRSIRSTGRLFRGAQRASAQMAHSDGVIGFAILAQPLRRRYQTVSLWETDADVDAFARSGDHHVLVWSLAPELESVHSTRWRVRGRDGRPRWEQAQRLLQQCRT